VIRLEDLLVIINSGRGTIEKTSKWYQ